MQSSRGSLAVIVVVGLLFFAPLLFQPTGVFYSDTSDFINYHLPCKHFLVRSWQETGELPRWCPYLLCGMPFLHDPQVAAFYPPNWPLLLIPPAHLGAAMSWLLVLHVIGAGLAMFAYARQQRLEIPAALVAAFGCMFAGKWLLHLLVGGHYNLAALAWTPLVLLLSERMLTRDCWISATLAGAVFALMVLGLHPQVTIYAALFVAGWTLISLAPADARPRLGRALLLGGWAALTAGLLSAVQTLPALEISRESSRALGVPGGLEQLREESRLTLLGLVGPALTTHSAWLWEHRGGLGLLWLALAAAAPVLSAERRVRAQAAFALVWLGLGAGGMLLLQWAPGLNLWRLPSRMLLLLAVPVALLAGRCVQQLLCAQNLEAGRSVRLILVVTAVAALGPLALTAFGWRSGGMALTFAPYWAVLAVVFVGAFWLLGRTADTRWLPAAWTGLLLAELWALSWPAVQVIDEAEVFAASPSASYLADHAAEFGRVLDINPVAPLPASEQAPSSCTPLWPNSALVYGVEPVRGYNPLDLVRTKEYFQFLMDADEPLAVWGHPFTLPAPGGFPLRNQTLANLLGVRYLLLPARAPLAAFAPQESAWREVLTDPAPRCYSFTYDPGVGGPAGFRTLPPYRLYENKGALPRAFVVHRASPLAERAGVLAQLKALDGRREVLLEGLPAASEAGTAPQQASTAVVREHLPNRVTVEVTGVEPGYLVLADPWFPGWTATVSGQPAAVERANYLFRAVAVPAGTHEVTFSFEPRSYFVGWWISVLSLSMLTSVGLVGALRQRAGRAAA